jgi:arabinoxylan arabinofuranohydrolase
MPNRPVTRHLSTLTVVALTALPATAQTPILPDFHADPSVHEWDGRVWIYPSHDLPGSTYWDMVDWHVFSSTDLSEWEDHGVIFSLDDVAWADRWAWAADAMKRNDRYYFYFTADDRIGVAVSDSPAGPFVDALGEPLIRRRESDTRVMDPAIFVDTDGQAYLYFGQDAARVVKLRDDMVTRDGPILPLDLTNFHEGIWVHERDGLYYVSYATWNHEADMASTLEYAVGKSPLGPFEHRGAILDNGSRNVHHSIAELGGRWYLFYHVQGPSPYERRVTAEFLEYEPDGSIRPLEMTREGISRPGRGPHPPP